MTTFIPWLPDSLQLTIERHTDVIPLADGKEMRKSLYRHPTIRVSAEYALVGPNISGDTERARRRLRSMLANSVDERLLIPLRPEAVPLVADVASGDAVYVVNAADASAWAVDGQDVYVEVDENEAGYQAQISGDPVLVGDDLELTLNTVAPDDLLAGNTRISPIVLVQPSERQTLGMHRVEHGTWSVDGSIQTFFAEPLGDSPVELPTFPEGVREFVIWDIPALQDGSAQIGEEFQSGLEFVGTVLVQERSLYAKSKVRRDLSFASEGLAEYRAWKRRIYDARGQQVPFLRPTFRDDLLLAVQPASPTGTLRVLEEPDYRPWKNGADTYCRLAVFLSDGTVKYDRVTVVTDNLDGTHSLTLATGFSRGAATVERISFLEATRMAADAAVLTCVRGGRMMVKIQTLTGNWITAPSMV